MRFRSLVAVALVLFVFLLFFVTACQDDDSSDDTSARADDDDDTADDDDDDDDDNNDNDDEPIKSKIAVISDLHHWYPDVDLDDGTSEPNYPALLVHEPLMYIRNEGPDISRAMILDAIDKGAKFIVLNGDFSDSRERAVYKAFTDELKEYEEQYDVDFFFVRGNHDAITNENHEIGTPHTAPLFDGELNNYWTYSIGAEELYELVAPYGLTEFDSNGSPENYIYWERGPETENGCGTLDPDGDCTTQTQFSYLVEPFENIWLLILDTNGFSTNGGGSGWEGDNFKTAKPRTWEWIQDVYERASQQDKSVIAFGHHALGDPLCGFTFEKFWILEEAIFNTKKSALELAEIGMGVYVSGHLHMDYISEVKAESSTLIDIQTPAIANYSVGYRLFTFEDEKTVQVETVVVRDVPNWDRYLSDYQAFAAQSDYSFEEFEVEFSTTFEEFVDRTFEHLMNVKVAGAIGESIFPLLKSLSLYNLMLLVENGKSIDLYAIENRTWLAPSKSQTDKAGQETLNGKIEAAGLSVDTFKNMNLYDFVIATVKIQFGAQYAFSQMEKAGTLEYYRFLMDQLDGQSFISISKSDIPSEPISIFVSVLEMLGNILNEYWWERPYTGPVLIDLQAHTIKEL